MHKAEPVLKLNKFKLSPQRAIGGQVYEFLRQAITRTCIKPGTVLSENKLSEIFGVSRQPVREALMRLRMEGLLAVYPQRGSVVQKISVSNLKQICFIRTAIETAALRQAAAAAPQVQTDILTKLQTNLKGQEELIADLSAEDAQGAARFLALDDEFHELICGVSGCPLAWSTVQSIKAQMDRIRYLSQGGVSPYAHLVQEHQGIYQELCAAQYEAAAAALTEHLAEILQTYVPIRRDNGQWFLPEEEDHI